MLMKMVGFRRAEALWFFTKLRRFDIPIRHTLRSEECD